MCFSKQIRTTRNSLKKKRPFIGSETFCSVLRQSLLLHIHKQHSPSTSSSINRLRNRIKRRLLLKMKTKKNLTLERHKERNPI